MTDFCATLLYFYKKQMSIRMIIQYLMFKVIC